MTSANEAIINTTPHHSDCALCSWRSEPYVTRDLAGCRASWHVYEDHFGVWQIMFGDRPPLDPDPRLMRS